MGGHTIPLEYAGREPRLYKLTGSCYKTACWHGMVCYEMVRTNRKYCQPQSKCTLLRKQIMIPVINDIVYKALHNSWAGWLCQRKRNSTTNTCLSNKEGGKVQIYTCWCEGKRRDWKIKTKYKLVIKLKRERETYHISINLADSWT